MWPTYSAAVVRNLSGQREAVVARWGLIAASGKQLNPGLATFNARCESVATTPTFKGAWAKGQRCVVPCEAIYEPDWRTGRHVPTRLQRVDGQPMGVAGLWDSWAAPTGEVFLSFTMLTVNAENHSLMKHLHKPQDEKRMVVILDEGDYDNWISAAPLLAPADLSALLKPYPVDKLLAISEPSRTVQDNPMLF